MRSGSHRPLHRPERDARYGLLHSGSLKSESECKSCDMIGHRVTHTRIYRCIECKSIPGSTSLPKIKWCLGHLISAFGKHHNLVNGTNSVCKSAKSVTAITQSKRETLCTPPLQFGQRKAKTIIQIVGSVELTGITKVGSQRATIRKFSKQGNSGTAPLRRQWTTCPNRCQRNRKVISGLPS